MLTIKGVRGVVWVFCLMAMACGVAGYLWLYFGRHASIYEAGAAGAIAGGGIGAVVLSPKTDLNKVRDHVRDLGPGKVTFGFLVSCATFAGFCVTAAQIPQPPGPSVPPNPPVVTTADPSPVAPGSVATSMPAKGVSCPLPRGHNVMRPPSSPLPTSTATGLGHAHIDGVAPYDGKPGVGPETVICLTITETPSSPNRQLWLVSRLNPFKTLTHPLYFAKRNLKVQLGRQEAALHSKCGSNQTTASIGSTRTLMVVSADEAASDILQENYDADQQCSGEYDPNRLALPPGASAVSNQADIVRAR